MTTNPDPNEGKTSVHDPFADGPTTEAEAVAALSNIGAPIPTIDLPDGLLLTRDGKGIIERWDPEPWAATPRRSKGTRVLDTEIAFGAFVNDHGIGDVTHVYAARRGLTFTAVFDDDANTNGNLEPGWRAYRASLALEAGESWKKWTAIDNCWQSQAEFIDLLEDRIEDVILPPATDLLEIARTFSMNKTVTFKSSMSLSTGLVQLQYDEEGAGAGGGLQNISVPERITLALHPIKGDEPVEVKARLRWRVEDGALGIMVKLDRLDDVLELAWAAVVDRVRAAVSPIAVLEGRPD